jgi:DNA replication protein DnaC
VRIVGLSRVGRRRRVGGGGRGERRKKRFSSCESFERIKEVFGSKKDDKNLDRMINQRKFVGYGQCDSLAKERYQTISGGV